MCLKDLLQCMRADECVRVCVCVCVLEVGIAHTDRKADECVCVCVCVCAGGGYCTHRQESG